MAASKGSGNYAVNPNIVQNSFVMGLFIYLSFVNQNSGISMAQTETQREGNWLPKI